MLEFRDAAHSVIFWPGGDDGVDLVLDEGHPLWAEALAASPAPFTPALPAPPTLEDYREAVQAHIDAVAKGRLYDNGVSLASYAASTNPAWAAEAQCFVAWRDEVWLQVYALWADPPEPAPDVTTLIAGLPAIAWP